MTLHSHQLWSVSPEYIYKDCDWKDCINSINQHLMSPGCNVADDLLLHKLSPVSEPISICLADMCVWLEPQSTVLQQSKYFHLVRVVYVPYH